MLYNVICLPIILLTSVLFGFKIMTTQTNFRMQAIIYRLMTTNLYVHRPCNLTLRNSNFHNISRSLHQKATVRPQTVTGDAVLLFLRTCRPLHSVLMPSQSKYLQEKAALRSFPPTRKMPTWTIPLARCHLYIDLLERYLHWGIWR